MNSFDLGVHDLIENTRESNLILYALNVIIVLKNIKTILQKQMLRNN